MAAEMRDHERPHQTHHEAQYGGHEAQYAGHESQYAGHARHSRFQNGRADDRRPGQQPHASDEHFIHEVPESSSKNSYGQSSNEDGGPPPVRRFNVATTGPFPTQKMFVYNHRSMRSLHRFLDDVGEKLHTGQIVRWLESPRGTRVRSLEDLKDQGMYKAVCRGDMARQAFGAGIPHHVAPMRVRRPPHAWVPRSNHYDYVSSRVMADINYRCKTVYIYLNGDFYHRPHRILIDRRIESQTRSFDILLKYTEEKVVSRGTRPVCVRKLYDLNTGRPVRDIGEIHDGMTLVACPAFERLIMGDYGRVDRPIHCGKPISSKRKAFLSKTPTPPEGKQRPSNENTPRNPEFDLSQMNPLPPLPPINRRPAPHSDHQRPPPRPAQPEDDFKAKKAREESYGAKEVAETEETVTDLPVEQRADEEVAEEQPMETDRYDREEPEDEAKREAAAVRIQANVRGFQTRKHMAAAKESQPAAAPEEAKEEAPKAQTPPPEPQEGSEEDPEEEKKRAEAATKIQAGFRGHKTRQELKGAQQAAPAQDEEPKEAAPADQEQTEEGPGKNLSEEEAAVKIQAGFRGYKTRKELHKPDEPTAEEPKEEPQEDDEDEKKRVEAATKIQANVRGHLTRKQLQDQKKAEEPQENGEAAQPDDEEEEKKRAEAATKIQAGFRGHKTREELKKQKEDQGEDANKEAGAEASDKVNGEPQGDENVAQEGAA